MRFERLRRFTAFRPPFEAAFRQTFLRDPETLRVVDQYFDSGRAPATEQEQATRKRISLQLLFASLSQRVNSFPEIHRLDGGQDAHLRCDLQHRSAGDAADHGGQSNRRNALHLNAHLLRAIG